MNKKTLILVESFGENIRLTLKEGQNGIAHCSFKNLAWLCLEDVPEYELESFIASREKVANAVKAFRCANVHQPRRGKGMLKQSPFQFSVVEQRNDTRNFNPHDLTLGDYQDTEDEKIARKIEKYSYNKSQKDIENL